MEYSEYEVEDESNILHGLEKEVDPNGDEDKDGLINSEEESLGTNLYSKDTDLDGLNDYFEVNTSKTNPLKEDTDEDGLNDANEYLLGLDPLKADSKNDGIIDGQRINTCKTNDEENGLSVEITGKGNIATIGIDKIKVEELNENNKFTNYVYGFNTFEEFENLSVVIKYNTEELSKKGLNEDEISLYYIDFATGNIEKIETSINKEEKTLTVTLNKLSNLIIGTTTEEITSLRGSIYNLISNTDYEINQTGFGADGYTVANSGLSISNDVLQFDNYSTNFNGGNCQGFAYLTMRYYRDELSMTGTAKFSYDSWGLRPGEYYNISYDLKNTDYDGFYTTPGRENIQLANTLNAHEINIINAVKNGIAINNGESVKKNIQNLIKSRGYKDCDANKIYNLLRALTALWAEQGAIQNERVFINSEYDFEGLINQVKQGTPAIIDFWTYWPGNEIRRTCNKCNKDNRMCS